MMLLASSGNFPLMEPNGCQPSESFKNALNCVSIFQVFLQPALPYSRQSSTEVSKFGPMESQNTQVYLMPI